MEIMASTPTLTPSNSSNSEREATKNELFSSVMKGDWKKVVELYRTRPMAHTLKITRSGHTALHLAISDDQESVVEFLVELIKAEDPSSPPAALGIKNEIGCTPLHFAASMGSPRMCRCIAGGAGHSLLLERNNKGETPLFWSVLYGQPYAFDCLDSLLGKEEDRKNCCRRSDGNTILHSAIYGELFDLAYQIMLRYGELVNSVNEEGISPLQILATKPSAFKSGSKLGRWGSIIYEWIYVDDKLMPYQTMQEGMKNDEKTLIKAHPENYHTCINFIELFAKAVRVVTSIYCKRGGTNSDLEDATQSAGRHKKPIAAEALDLPANYATCFEFGKFIYKIFLVVVGLGYMSIDKIKEEKTKHVLANRVLDKLLDTAKMYDYEDPGASPAMPFGTEEHVAFGEIKAEISSEGNSSLPNPQGEKKIDASGEKKIDASGEKNFDPSETKKKDTAILIAAKNGILEMVEKILGRFPVAVHDVDQENKNILLLVVENRQVEVYKFLIERNIMKGIMFRKVDNQWNSALHFAATLGDDHKPWPIPGAALQMQWEIKWYKYIESSRPRHFFLRTNKEGKTPDQLFTKTHKGLVKSGGEWLTSTSTACSLVAVLVATVAFAASTTVPGGVDEHSGKPTLQNRPAFELFAASSLAALCFSITSLVMFLAILTSRYQEKDFGKDLPRKLLIGLTSLFVSIASMVCAFCAGHFFVLEDKLKYAAYPVYIVTCFPVSLFAVAQFPLYLDLVKATFWSPF